MQITIQPNYIKGSLKIPASKSFMQRACAAALIKGGKTIINNYGISNDDKSAINTIQQLGAIVKNENEQLIIESNFNGTSTIPLSNLQLYESGLGLRMFTPIAALLQQPITINGEGSLLKRPMHFFDEIFPELNVKIKTKNGYLPFLIEGSLVPKDITIDGSLSSQFLTGLLMAFSFKNTDTTITVNNLISKPYIDITLSVLQSFGLNVPINDDYREFVFTKKEIKTNKDINYTIESDWSSASFFLVAAAINGNCIFTGLNFESLQADIKIIEALRKANVNFEICNEKISIQKSSIQPFNFDATECPDLFPPLVALASNAIGISVIKGVSRLLHKESNRALTLQKEFDKLGVKIILENNEMQIFGKENINVIENNFESHNDHRIAMALAIAVLNADKPTTINGAEAVNKSYPNFWEDLEKLKTN